MFPYLNPNAKVVFATSNADFHTFYGYYTQTPFSPCGHYHLAHRTTARTALLSQDTPLDIGTFDLKTGTFESFGQTRSANWQQGSFLQWLPGSGRTVVWNDVKEGARCARVLDLETGKERILPAPIYAINANGDHALIVDYDHITAMRPSYGFPGEGPNLDGIAIAEMAIADGCITPLLSFDNLRTKCPTASEQMTDWVDHPLYSPDGKAFIFNHRVLRPGETGFDTFLFHMKPESRELHLYPGAGFYSHTAWISNKTFVVFGRPPNKDATPTAPRGGLARSAARLAVKMIPRLEPLVRRLRDSVFKNAYLSFTIGSNDCHVLSTALPTEDGHPNRHPYQQDILLTDTYPDTQGKRHLYIVNTNMKTCCHVCSVHSPEGETPSSADRCDMHPRWSPDGKSVSIDLIHADRRQIAVLDVTGLPPFQV